MNPSKTTHDPAGGKQPQKDTRRVFVAVHLPDPVRKTLAEVQHDLRKYAMKIRWTRPETIHLTLKFLGDVPVESISGICESLKTAVGDLGAFHLEAKGVGVFPGVRRPKVLWTGLSGQTDRLETLHHAIDGALAELGFARDDRRFTGHLTLGRFTGHPDPEILIDILKAYTNKASESFAVEEVHVTQSDLKPSGPIYTDLCGVRFEA